MEEVEKDKIQARRTKGSISANESKSAGPQDEAGLALLGDLAGSPGLDLQTNLLHFLPEQNFLVAGNLDPYTQDGISVPRGAVSHFQDSLGCGSILGQDAKR